MCVDVVGLCARGCSAGLVVEGDVAVWAAVNTLRLSQMECPLADLLPLREVAMSGPREADGPPSVGAAVIVVDGALPVSAVEFGRRAV